MAAKDLEKTIVNDWNNNSDTEITEYLQLQGIKGTAEHIGSKQFPPTSEWKKWNKQKSYGKTDIKIGGNNTYNTYKISLKSTNDHIMMAAKKNEALATFMCVADELYEKKIPSIISELADVMEEMVSGVSPITITKAKKAG